MFWEKFANFHKIFDITKLEKQPMIANPSNFPHKFGKSKRTTQSANGEMTAVVWPRVLRSTGNGEVTVVACGGNACVLLLPLCGTPRSNLSKVRRHQQCMTFVSPFLQSTIWSTHEFAGHVSQVLRFPCSFQVAFFLFFFLSHASPLASHVLAPL
jgi:hypothetical protein